MRSRLHIDLPHPCAVDFYVQSALRDVAVGANSHIKETAIGAGGHRLRPVMVDPGWQFRQRRRRTARGGLAVLIVKPHNRILVGDVNSALYEGEAVGSIEIVGKDAALLIGAITISVTQQGDAIAAFDRTLAQTLDVACDHILRTDCRRSAA